ncbi:MAG TPA: acyloxyacyl hydrolase [Nitrospirota bacterium]
MKTVALFLFLLFLSSATADAAGLFIEGGEGFYFSHDTEAVIVRFQLDAPKLFGLEGFYEATYASWNGHEHDEAIALARGVRWVSAMKSAVSLTAGLSYISRTTSHLGQPFEFYGRLAFDEEIGRAFVSIGWLHYSDAKFLFQWSGPNDGENFLTLTLGVYF